MKQKKMTKEDFFHIEKSHLKDDRIFAFNLYIYHPVTKNYTIYLYGNSPLTNEKSDFLDFILSKGGELAVSIGQSKTFLRPLELTAADVPSLKLQPEEERDLKARESLAALSLSEEDTFSFKKVLSQAAGEDDYLALIQRARIEIMAFSPRVSNSVSLATYLADKFLKKDTHINRIVAISYFLAKNMDIKDAKSLGELVCAAFLSHIGQTQLDLFYSQNATLKFSSKQKSTYQKHPGLAHHLIKKSKCELSERVLKIIEGHHERFDGRGYPAGIMGSAIDPLSLILGAVAHVLEYSSGRITGNEVPLSAVLRNLADKTFAPGLEFQFGDTIYDNLINLLTSQAEEQAA